MIFSRRASIALSIDDRMCEVSVRVWTRKINRAPCAFRVPSINYYVIWKALSIRFCWIENITQREIHCDRQAVVFPSILSNIFRYLDFSVRERGRERDKETIKSIDKLLNGSRIALIVTMILSSEKFPKFLSHIEDNACGGRSWAWAMGIRANGLCVCGACMAVGSIAAWINLLSAFELN